MEDDLDGELESQDTPLPLDEEMEACREEPSNPPVRHFYLVQAINRASHAQRDPLFAYYARPRMKITRWSLSDWWTARPSS
jgi:hypothetical protein